MCVCACVWVWTTYTVVYLNGLLMYLSFLLLRELSTNNKHTIENPSFGVCGLLSSVSFLFPRIP